jgi:DNA-binding NtrC family response regulator
MDAVTRPLPERVVLVVDDEDVVRHLTTRIVADAGFFGLGGPSWGRSRDAAVDPQREPPTGGERHSHAELPRVDLAELMAAQWPAVPVLLISGQGGPPADYAGPFLPKPFMPEALVEAVTGLLPIWKH